MKFSSILICASSVNQSEKDANYRTRPSSNPRSSARCHGFRHFLRVFGEAKLNETQEKLRIETRAHWKTRFFSPEVDSPQKNPIDRPTSEANRDNVLNTAYERAFDSVRSHSTIAILEGEMLSDERMYAAPHVYADVLEYTSISVPQQCGRTLARTHDVPAAHGEAAPDKAPKKPPRRKRVYRRLSNLLSSTYTTVLIRVTSKENTLEEMISPEPESRTSRTKGTGAKNKAIQCYEC